VLLELHRLVRCRLTRTCVLAVRTRTIERLVSAPMLVIILICFVLYACQANHLEFIVKWKTPVREDEFRHSFISILIPVAIIFKYTIFAILKKVKRMNDVSVEVPK